MNASADRVSRAAVALGLMLGASLLHACMAKKEAGTSPADAGAAEYADATADPLTQLAQLEGRMLQLGLTPAQPKGAGAGEAPPNDGTPVEEQRVDEAVGEGELEKTEDKLDDQRNTTQAGTVPPTPEPHPAPMAVRDNDGESRCTSVCELSEAICELEVRICTMAKNHGTDPTYSDACERAVDDCEVSGEACDTCVE